MPPKHRRQLSSADIADMVVDPAAYLFCCLEAQEVPFRFCVETRRTDEGLLFVIVDTSNLHAKVRWHWRWQRHASAEEDRLAEDDAYRQTLMLMLDDKFIKPVPLLSHVATG